MRAERLLGFALVSVLASDAFAEDELLRQPIDCFVRSATPDGRFLGCQRLRGGLGIFDRERNELILDTGEPGDWEIYGPVIAPDGDRIAASWNAGGRSEIRIVYVSGSSEVIRRAEGAAADPVAWSRDGRFLVVLLGQTLTILSTDGDVEKELEVFDNGVPRNVRFSPDGRHVVFAHYPESPGVTRELFLLPVDGGTPRALTSLPGEAFFPTWVSNGTGIFFLRSLNGSTDAWFLPMNDGAPSEPPRKLQTDLGDIIPIELTDAGDLLYTRLVEDRDVFIGEVDFAAQRITTPPTPIAPELAGTKTEPSFSPDGERIVFLLVRGWGPRRSVVVRELETGESRVYDSLRDAHRPHWSSDGSSVVVQGTDREGRDGTFALDPKTGELTPVARSRWSGRPELESALAEITGLERPRHVSVHPDGRHVVFTAGEPIFGHFVTKGVVTASVIR